MSRRTSLVLVGLALTAAAGPVLAGGAKLATKQALTIEQKLLANDPPASHLAAVEAGVRADTLWYGGRGPDGLTVLDGVWDFDDGTTQGWNGIDLTAKPIYFRHVTADSALAHGDPVDPTITMGGSTGSMWVGAHEDEANALCWPGGQGYSNSWGQSLSRSFTYGGSNSVTISFDYFVDSETGFDFTYVYVVNNDGTQSLPLNTSDNPDGSGYGYSGALNETVEVGTPSAPVSDALVVDVADLPGGAGLDFEVMFNFDSDPLYSDGLDSFSGFLNSAYGPFGVDNVRVQGIALNELSDYEPTGTPGEEYDGWSASTDAAIGSLFKIENLAALDPVGDACACPLENEVMVMAITDGSDFAHPKRQFEEVQSNPTFVGVGSPGQGRNSRVIVWDAWIDLPNSNGVGYRQSVHYYPWTCPQTGTVGWTIEPAGDSSFTFASTATCGAFIEDVTQYMPATGVDSVKVVFRLQGDCDDFGTTDCTGPEQTNQSPYIDNVRLGLVGQDQDAPSISWDIRYQDAYPQSNSLLPNAVADMDAYFDNNRSDTDQTNAFMGDSVVVNAGTDPNTEVYLNFRVYPGPSMNTSDAWFTKYGTSSLAPSWGKARMDTTQTSTSTVNGRYSSYTHEDDAAFSAPEWIDGRPNEENEILPDGFFTPGTTIEYFFSSNYTGNPDTFTDPDTTGAFFYEVEVLPGYFESGGDVMTPCLLYVDAFNFGAQVPIEEKGLDPFLGRATDDDGIEHPLWDRYDYLDAPNNSPAPLAREASGDNGMTKYQSMVYRTVLYNTGTWDQEGLRDGDAGLLSNWLTNDDFDRWAVDKGLWLSGNGMPTILDRDGRPENNNLLANFVQATVSCGGSAYYTPGCGGGGAGDSTLCVRVDAVTGRHFPASGDGYASIRGNGCPSLLEFQVVATIGDGQGNLAWVDQDGGGAVTQYASVSNDQFAPGNPANYGVVMDAFSLHYMRSTPDGWNGSDCGTDSAAIGQRVADVLTFLRTPIGACDPEGIFVGVGDGPSGVPGARTALFQNTPNPFNPRTTVRYQLGESAHVKLRVFDVNGRLVRTLVDQAQSADSYEIVWDGRSDLGETVASGIYWARMSTSAGYSAATKMVVLK